MFSPRNSNIRHRRKKKKSIGVVLYLYGTLDQSKSTSRKWDYPNTSINTLRNCAQLFRPLQSTRLVLGTINYFTMIVSHCPHNLPLSVAIGFSLHQCFSTFLSEVFSPLIFSPYIQYTYFLVYS